MAVLSPGGGNVGHGTSVRTATTAEELAGFADRIVAVGIDGDDDYVNDQAYRLRQQPETTLLPAFRIGTWDDDAYSATLLDGAVRAVSELPGRAEQIVASDGPPPEADASREQVLLRLLAERDGMTIRPWRDWRAATIYRYPLLEALLGDDGESTDWLRFFSGREWIAPARLVDRLRLCSSCRTAHLIFVDRCPDCTAIDIERTKTIHCFGCGHVAPQSRFESGNLLVCPNCSTRLRHIGSDYDRPLESYHCHGCHRLFVEPEVVARCAACAEITAPEDLVVHPVHDYAVTARGRLAARHGSMGELASILDEINYLTPDAFVELLRWQFSVIRRYEDARASLAVIRLSNLIETVESLGRSRTAILLQGFAEQLQALVRDSDLCTRTDENLFWVFLPQTQSEGGHGFLKRVHELARATEQPEGVALECVSAARELTAGLVEHTDAQTLMNELAAEVGA